jgi:hypothetical protein
MGDGESVSHDGSISGIVFLVSVVVVLCIILVIGSVGQDDDNVHTNLFTITMQETIIKSKRTRKNVFRIPC